MSVVANILKIKSQIPHQVKLIAVSKTQPVERILEAYQAGQRDFGENKVQELVSKAPSLPSDIQWHHIGHLQSNKVKYIAPFVHMIHAVDSLKLLEIIDREAKKVNRVIPCLLQMHIAKEETKFGLNEMELKSLVDSLLVHPLPNVQIRGLMGMATFTGDMKVVESEFRYLKGVFDSYASLQNDQIRMQELSMGMSGDYLTAIAAGSTMIRVGSQIFGAR